MQQAGEHDPTVETPEHSAPVPAALCPSAGRLKTQRATTGDRPINFTNIGTRRDRRSVFTQKYTEYPGSVFTHLFGNLLEKKKIFIKVRAV